MRHHVKKRTLHRDRRQRTALIRSLIRSLVLHEGIVTTLAKAKEVRPAIEKLITEAKDATNHRTVFAKLRCEESVRKLCDQIAKRYMDRAGGYTRIIKLGQVGKRVGEHAKIELLK